MLLAVEPLLECCGECAGGCFRVVASAGATTFAWYDCGATGRGGDEEDRGLSVARIKLAGRMGGAG